jgi:chemotaxis protein histidine kinase CheA
MPLKKECQMLNIRRGSLYLFGPAFILIFIFTVLAGTAFAQNKEPEVTKNPPRKPVVAKPGKTPPKLKPAPRTAKLVTAKKSGKAAAAPGGEAEHSLAAPALPAAAKGAAEDTAKTSATELKIREKEKHTLTTVSEIPAKTGPSKKAPAKAVKLEVKEKSAATVAAKKAEPKTKAPEKIAAKVTPKITDTPAVTAAKKPAVKIPDAKKSEVKKETAVAVAPVKSAPAKKKTAPALKAETKTKDTSEIESARAPAKAWLPRITAENVRSDISGKTIADIPSEETGDGTADWLFAPNQPKDIEILNTDQRGDELTVEARVAAKKTRANLDGSYDRVRGVARLYYLRGERKWELKRVENISLRHGDTGLDSPLPGSPTSSPNANASVISAPPLNILPEGGRVDVAAGKYRSYSFRVEKAAVVTGRFQAQGGGQNDIEAYILDQDGFLNWSNDHSAPAYYNSGRLTVGAIETPLGPGTYYLVFNNRFSRSEGKLIDAGVTLRTDSAYLARFDRADQAYNGTGIASGGNSASNGGSGTVNTVRRIYGPGASPAPAYTPPAEQVEKRDANMAANMAGGKTGPPVKQQMAVAGYESEAIFTGSIRVDNGGHHAVPFTVGPGGLVRGTFMVADDQSIDAYIMSAREYERWNYSREGVMDFSSGRVSSGRIERKFEPGDYYLVFSNHFSQREPKTVKAEIHVEYSPR